MLRIWYLLFAKTYSKLRERRLTTVPADVLSTVIHLRLTFCSLSWLWVHVDESAAGVGRSVHNLVLGALQLGRHPRWQNYCDSAFDCCCVGGARVDWLCMWTWIGQVGSLVDRCLGILCGKSHRTVQGWRTSSMNRRYKREVTWRTVGKGTWFGSSSCHRRKAYWNCSASVTVGYYMTQYSSLKFKVSSNFLVY